jgi:antitoxin VapB
MSFETVAIKSTLGHQTISIPDNLRINDDKVYLKKVGDALFIIPYHGPWQNLVQSLEKFTPDFMEERNQPTDILNRESLE